ncbi:MAG: aminotransferase class III-fold pyridoxal phosphate-dependent enzyme [Pseudomonadota bacterium]
MTNEAAQKNDNDWIKPYWMPFTSNKAFRADPRIMARAEGHYYYTEDGRKILDAFSGLWCVNLGHNHPKIVEAIQRQAAQMDYSPAFNFGHSQIFELAKVVTDQFPDKLNHAFFTNSGSEAADTALKLAIAYHRMRGEGGRTRLIGRERGYHGVGFGGISVGGMVNNRKFFGSLLPGTDHMSFPYDQSAHAFTRGEPQIDPEPYMKELEHMITLHDPSTIAAVIVEPFAGSGGVYVPPAGYLKRLREVTEKHGILLIVDEVISAFGRIGDRNAASLFGVQPDIVTIAKGINNGSVPLGAAIIQDKIYDTFMEGTKAGVEFFHGYTYSGHPLAAAAALATQEVFREEGAYDNAKELMPFFEEAVHSLKGEPFVHDIRNMGLAAGITVERKEMPGDRATAVFKEAFANGVYIRNNGDDMAISPILTFSKDDVEVAIETVRKALRSVH